MILSHLIQIDTKSDIYDYDHIQGCVLAKRQLSSRDPACD